MGKVPPKLDWDALLSSKGNEAPPAEGEVVQSSVDHGLIRHLSDQAIQEKIRRTCRTLSPDVHDKLPDKGAKLRSSIQQLQAELDRRKLVKARKDAERSESARVSEAKDSSGLRNDSSPCTERKPQQPSFASLLFKKLEVRADPAPNGAWVSVTRGKCENSRKVGRRLHEHRKPTMFSSQPAKMSFRSSPFQCANNPADKDDCRIAEPSPVGRRFSSCLSKKKASEINHASNPRSRKGAEMETQLKTQSSLKENIVWTIEMDNCLTEALIEQVQQGLKPDRSFPYTAYQTACDELFAKCGIRVGVAHLKNHIKTLKKDLGAFQDMLNFGSGFAFNKVTRMMDAEPKVWEVYLAAHPEARQYQHKFVPSFENLQIIYGRDRATGLGDEIVKETRIRLEKEKEASDSINIEQEGDKEIDEEDDLESVASSSHQEQAPKACSAKVGCKRKYGASNHNINEGFYMLKTGMDSIASAIFSCAPRVCTEDEIFEEVSKIEGLDEDSQLLAYDYLCENAVRGRAFLGLPINRRKRWLELKLGRG